jgi:predicted DNA primase small subunit
MGKKTKYEIPKNKVSEYYTDHFHIDEMKAIIGIDDFTRREFGWMPYPEKDVPGKKIFTRNHRFANINEFKTKIASIVPFKLYFGAVYQREWHGTIMGVPWSQNELHFDIDVNDSDVMRRGGICKCAKSNKKDERKKVCPSCFQLVKESTMFLIDTLDGDFNIPRSGALVYFSGSRGFHVHYPEVMRFSHETNEIKLERDEKNIRRNLIGYLNLVKEEEVETETTIDGEVIKKIEITANVGGAIESRTLKERIDRLVYKWFFTGAPEQTIRKLHVSSISIDVIRRMFSEGKFMGDITKELVQRSLVTARQLARLREIVLSYRYPRYDGSTTYDVRKVIKVPGSIDCSTGFIVSRINDVESFTMEDIDRVENHVSW